MLSFSNKSNIEVLCHVPSQVTSTYYYYYSRNVAFKARKLRDSIMECQDSFIMRELEDAEVDFLEDGEDVAADVGNNADLYLYLYAANQESTDLINEAHIEEAPLRFMGQDAMYFTISRLVSTKRR